jgi:hypothetical protein
MSPVEKLHHSGLVPVPDRRTFRRCLLQPVEFIRGKGNLARANVFLQALRVAGARYGNDVLPLRKDPPKSELRRCYALSRTISPIVSAIARLRWNCSPWNRGLPLRQSFGASSSMVRKRPPRAVGDQRGSKPWQDPNPSPRMDALRKRAATGNADVKAFWTQVTAEGTPIVEQVEGDPHHQLTVHLTNISAVFCF